MIALAVAVGALIGLSLGALGGGGSILTVPALVYLLGQSPHQATTASLLVVGIAAITGAVTHARAGRARLKIGAIFGLPGIAGSYAGSLASAAVPASALLAGFGVLMLIVVATMVFRRRIPGLPGAAGHPRGSTRHVAVVAAAATAVGLITGFFGVGGGFVASRRSLPAGGTLIPRRVFAEPGECQLWSGPRSYTPQGIKRRLLWSPKSTWARSLQRMLTARS